jgi:hypothetical protein
MNGSPIVSVEYRIEVKTPLLLHGSDTNVAEIRTPPFRGLLRYWLRAAVRGAGGDDKTLRSVEQRLFGAAGESGSQGSAIRTLLVEVGTMRRDSFKVLPHSTDPKKKATAPQGIAPGARLTCRLLRRPGTSDEIWKLGNALVPVAVSLGGLGMRSRRGFGTLRMDEAPSIVDAIRELRELVAASAIKGAVQPRRGETAANVPRLNEQNCVVLEGVSSAGRRPGFEEMLTTLMTAMHAAHQNGAGGATFGQVRSGRKASAIHVRILPDEGKFRLSVFRLDDANRVTAQMRTLCDQLNLQPVWGERWF